MKYHFLILAFNEEDLLEKTFKELHESILEENISDYIISIVDDGSSDNTFIIANNIKTKFNKNLNIIQNKKNIGVANSVKNYINSNDEGKLFLISGDNDLGQEMVRDLIKASKKADFVLSSYLNREKKGRFRAFLSTTFNLMMCTIFDVYVFYLQGPAVWPIKYVKQIDISSSGIAYASEVHIKLLYSGLKFIEITGYCNTGSIKSTAVKLSSFFDIFRTLLSLIYEIKIKKKYNHKSIRVQ